MKQNGFLSISIPAFIISQFSSGSSSASHQLLVDGSSSSISLSKSSPNFVVPITSATSSITLTLDSITNPSDNQPFQFMLEQASDSAFAQVYGKKSFSVAMNKFDPITVTSANRSATKVGIPVNLTLDITSPSYTGSMVINFPTSQVFTQSSCSIKINGQTSTCSVVNSTAIMTTNVPNNGVYVISGLLNQLSFSSASQYDLIEVRIGQPYTKAATVPSTSTFLSPSLTLGAITLNSLTSSSLVLLSKTNLIYNFTI